MKDEKINILDLSGDDRQKAIEQLSEGGKFEILPLSLYLQGKSYEAVLKISFSLIRKGMAALINTNLTGNKSEQNVNVSIDDVGAGDLLLFQGWYEGDDSIKKKIALRTKACKYLGQWLQSYMDDMQDEEEEAEGKKN